MPSHRQIPLDEDFSEAATVRRLAIFEPRLREVRGHFTGMAIALATAARAEGIAVSVWCDRLVTPEVRQALTKVGAEVRPVLRGSTIDALRARALIWSVLAADSVAGLRAARRHVGPNGVVFLPSGEIDTALASALAADDEGASIAVQFFYWNRRAFDGRWTPLSNAIIAIARSSVRRAPRGLCLLAHGSAMASELQKLLGRKVFSVPLAVDWDPIPRAAPERAPGRIRVGVLGELRDEKGLEQLAEVVPMLGEQVEWHVQAAPGPSADEATRRLLVARVRNAAGVVYEAPLDRAAYGRLVVSCDVAVFPYDPRRYGTRTSGTLIEALGVASVPVVPAETWLADEAGDAAVIYSPYTTRALADAVKHAVKLAQTGRDARIARASEVRDANSASAVVRAVCSAVTAR